MVFIILFGIVSLFSNMTHEGAFSIRGAYLALLGPPLGHWFCFRPGELTIAVSVVVQLTAIPFYLASARTAQHG